ncbi:Cytochrome c1 [Parasphingorhabdus marina DSM 22363]|uniref:Cytochrome c1 n=1 Tax=Parasphingorhabdus marina DSM 22363 TaxID=1123272 RepID=A0A1N6CMC9_9SPHN|nr:c-type cytochrome [Parasphingorhabdus marina]SIN59721.1 Cytochrome c1 [Parasphingorhabdus marina DSM 22363]
MSRKKIAVFGLLFFVLAGGVLWFAGTRQGDSASRPTVAIGATSEELGAAVFVGESFGGVSMDALDSNALPWKLAAAALVLEEMRRDPSATMSQASLSKILKRFGFLYPNKIENLPNGLKRPESTMPLGMTFGEIAPIGGTKVMVSNLGCAACHAGVTYSSDGTPQTEQAVLGMPNSSLNLEAYTQAVFVATRQHLSSERLMEAVTTLFPETDWRERQSLRWLVMPLARQRLAELEGKDRPLPFPNGVPGSTNGVAALKAALGVPLVGGGPDDRGFVSIPDLSYRTWRTSLLVDGAYAVPEKPRQTRIGAANIGEAHLRSLAEITTFFTVPSMGVHPDVAKTAIDDGVDVMTFLHSYRPQAFPGPIDKNAAREGAIVYKQHCAACHGDYAESPSHPILSSFPNWIGDVGTDKLRSDVFGRELSEAIQDTSYDGLISVATGQGYVAPPLSGIWASAPYLHNGSVTSLWALLTPEQRQKRFQVGGHALDFDLVGLRLNRTGRYPAGYTPFAQPVWIETDEPGNGNRGHNYGKELNDQEKRDLIEFLKQL